MKRLQLKAKPKRLSLGSTTQQRQYDIEQLLEQHHKLTIENKNLPYFEWIPIGEHVPLDTKEPVLIYDSKYSRMYDTLSFIALQHYLWSKYKKYDNIPSHWMRLKLPEEV